MLSRWDKKLNLFAPIEQAQRCLDTWLKEEGRVLNKATKKRAAALMARYFQHEDEVGDEIMMSFLRHYSGKQVMDIEDPTSVRLEIKTLLDRSRAREESGARTAVFSFAIGVLLVLLALGGWHYSQKTITVAQQEELKTLVRQITELEKNASAASVWAEIKSPLGVKKYQDIRWRDYGQSRDHLKKRLEELQNASPVPAGAGM